MSAKKCSIAIAFVSLLLQQSALASSIDVRLAEVTRLWTEHRWSEASTTLDTLARERWAAEDLSKLHAKAKALGTYLYLRRLFDDAERSLAVSLSIETSSCLLKDKRSTLGIMAEIKSSQHDDAAAQRLLEQKAAIEKTLNLPQRKTLMQLASISESLGQQAKADRYRQEAKSASEEPLTPPRQVYEVKMPAYAEIRGKE